MDQSFHVLTQGGWYNDALAFHQKSVVNGKFRSDAVIWFQIERDVIRVAGPLFIGVFDDALNDRIR